VKVNVNHYHHKASTKGAGASAVGGIVLQCGLVAWLCDVSI